MRRLTVNVRVAAGTVLAVIALPVLMGLGAKWSARGEIDQLRSANARLDVENGSYRAATGELTAQIQSLETVINDLGARSQLDPVQARAMQKLPAVIKTRAAGGSTIAQTSAVAELAKAALSSPEDTFGVLRDLLQGLDISTEKGQPVYATADGTIESVAYTGDYGNLIVVQHGFGLVTRYGHLSAFHVKPGQAVKRGDVIGYVGATGRATGAHLHYEIVANGRLINPLQILTESRKA